VKDYIKQAWAPSASDQELKVDEEIQGEKNGLNPRKVDPAQWRKSTVATTHKKNGKTKEG